jgi:hypothetical protein
LSEQRAGQMKDGEARIEEAKELRDKALADLKAAIEREREAQSDQGDGFFASVWHAVKDVAIDTAECRQDSMWEDLAADGKTAWDSPKFWSDLETGAKYVAIAGAAAATLLTAGAAGPAMLIVALALSGAGFAVQQTKCLDGAFGNGASQWIGGGLEFAGAATGGVGALAAGSSAAAGAAGTANVIAGGATVVEGGAHARNGEFAGRALDARADATDARHRMDRMQRLVTWLLDGIKEMDKSHKHALETLQGAMKINDQTLVTSTSINTRG